MEESGWVIENRLARSSRPGRWTYGKNPVPSEMVKNWITMVQARGIRSIICLLSHEEIERYYPGINLIASYQEKGLQVEHIPTHDYRDPPLTAEELDKVWVAWKKLPKPVLVHCSAGADRTGQAVEYIKGRIDR